LARRSAPLIFTFDPIKPPARPHPVGPLSRIIRRIVFWLLAGPIIVLLLLFVVYLAGLGVDMWQQSKEQARLAAALEALPVRDSRMTLYSLRPYPKPEGSAEVDASFHEFLILGSREISDPAEKQRLITLLAGDIRRQISSTRKACFNPRHGLRIAMGSEICDLVICFECDMMHAYGFAGGKYIPITGGAQGEFNALLDRYRLERVPSRHAQKP